MPAFSNPRISCYAKSFESKPKIEHAYSANDSAGHEVAFECVPGHPSPLASRKDRRSLRGDYRSAAVEYSSNTHQHHILSKLTPNTRYRSSASLISSVCPGVRRNGEARAFPSLIKTCGQERGRENYELSFFPLYFYVLEEHLDHTENTLLLR
ncbi:hypothetical protein SCHPADRAFT_395380 [Schizopora paradoxa]|uniref:Uncharacterized protein n=1 Tax=Schizopora paradoxa TaxID=27342 RepID=A0A0H2RLV1_9AGAM|nr:hypothetical protein SCHPADRAFT_395380 [Schizopora paradoxa]